MYKGITLTVQEKCAKCIKLYKTPKRICMIFKQLEFDIKTIIDNFFSFFYQTISLRHSLQKLTQEIKLKSIMFELFIISKLNEICIFTILPL